MHFTIKPVSFSCNLNCDYCFYLPKGHQQHMLTAAKMPEDMVLVLTQKVLEYMQDCNSSNSRYMFTWQGGEPMLAGLDFYKRAVAIQQELSSAYPNVIIENAIQTNGTLLNEEWCQFLKEHQFLVGISIDGPEHIHNQYRRLPNGEGSFNQVMQGIELLKKNEIMFNTLSCITKANYQHGLEVYRFLRDEVKSRYLQFSEVVETTPENSDADHIQNHYDSKPFSLPRNGYGTFMAPIFKEWMANDFNRLKVRQFETMLSRVLGTGHISCVFEDSCPNNFAIEANGDIYQCDQFVYPKYKIANIMDVDLKLAKLSSHDLNKCKARLPKACQKCVYLPLCNGGCVKHRILKGKDQEAQSYFCEGYKDFFDEILPYLNASVEFTSQGLPYFYLGKQVTRIVNLALNGD